MRGYFNIIVNGRVCGVLVSDSKYHRTFRKASGEFKQATVSAFLKNEIMEAFILHPELKEKFLNGESIIL